MGRRADDPTIVAKIQKLPKWAQELIHEKNVHYAVLERTLQDFENKHNKGAFKVTEFVPGTVNRNASMRINAHRLDIDHAGVHVMIILRDGEVDISYCREDGGITSPVNMIPSSYQQFKLKVRDSL